MKSVSDILQSRQLAKDPRNKYEFQAYGNKLAETLRDTKHRTLYIKLAKLEKRELLDTALAFTLDTDKRLGLGKTFMWKLTELKKEPSKTA
ncbi:MAG: hypothetical protein UW65_C0012G0012 [candidate division WWE3 bacterium GW2011_GWB1_44_4]|uniref:Uncharacterized protein n=1 Tax=candidate division WWE3 bacterium GW2011_GWB1_44_4 TaxID=1619116 RepID=A0A0G1MCX2_UNCKA|nr:MAG: hypothetical protein UW65_C0012G0012 [candidate division WWE3 bacterium GW2011_GWB1_44_4]